jgi:peptide-methionine (S)-S-oxide reductase
MTDGGPARRAPAVRAARTAVVSQTALALILLLTPVGARAAGAPRAGQGAMNDKKTEIATLAGGCFWCMEAVFEDLKGVERVVSGYAGGTVRNPTYEQVSTGTTGHAESIQITFDPAVISYRDLLRIFFGFHDPTTLNRQGNDVGTQYRSAIFWHDPGQRAAAEGVIAELTREHLFSKPIVTQVVPYSGFYPAEKYHQGYYKANSGQPYCQLVISPKVAKLKKLYAAKLKTAP